MNCYIISYDLANAEANDYEKLVKTIRSYKTYAHILDSLWAVKTDETATELRNKLKKCTKQHDRIFVIKSGVASAWSNVICKNEWLKKHL